MLTPMRSVGKSRVGQDSNDQGGKLKLLGVTNAERWPLLANVPTIGETLPGFSADPWFGLFVPRGTPQVAIDRLNAAVNKMKDEEAVKKNFAEQGMLPRAGTPAAFDAIVRKDYARWSKVVADIGFKPSE